MPIPDYYGLLQVSPTAEFDVIFAAYKKLAFKNHPDRNPDSSAGRTLQLLNEAVEVLTDPVRRSEYDKKRAAASGEQNRNEFPQEHSVNSLPEPASEFFNSALLAIVAFGTPNRPNVLSMLLAMAFIVEGLRNYATQILGGNIPVAWNGYFIALPVWVFMAHGLNIGVAWLASFFKQPRRRFEELDAGETRSLCREWTGALFIEVLTAFVALAIVLAVYYASDSRAAIDNETIGKLISVSKDEGVFSNDLLVTNNAELVLYACSVRFTTYYTSGEKPEIAQFWTTWNPKEKKIVHVPGRGKIERVDISGSFELRSPDKKTREGKFDNVAFEFQ